MCGIAGYHSNNTIPDMRLNFALSLMGVFMEDRGTDSWGWSDGNQVVKAVGRFRDGYNTSMFNAQSAFVHTRHGTSGKNTAENAHPFSIKGMIGCHNGIVYNHRELAKKYDIEYEVDSELIFHAIADGIPMSELNGYGTIVFYRDGHIHLGRFSTRGDLDIAKTDVGWVWASEKEAVQSAVDMTGITVNEWIVPALGKLYRIEGDNLVETNQDMTLGTYVPAKGADWRDFRSGGSNFSSGYPTIAAKAGHYWSWDSEKKLYFERAITYLNPLPTAATTTFTASEPTSDEDEVIDVSDGDMNDGFLRQALAEMSRKDGIDDIDDDTTTDDGFYSWVNFYETVAEEYFPNNWGQCADCLEYVWGKEPIYVQQWTEETFCEDCYERNVKFAPNDQPVEGDEAAWMAELEERGELFAAQANYDTRQIGHF
jgi:hypothetical protein